MMGIFSSIKNAIFHSGRDQPEEKAKPAGDAFPAAPAPAPTPSAPQPAPAAAPEPISEAAMADRISRMPGADKHNWRTSIVDLMKMVGVDPSFENRKELADELGLEGYTGTAEQNIALHHAVLNMLAAEGGAMPDMLRN
ncbi:DUF3597 family protein [Erythrobacter sp. WG]|uniref:DUF3597 family protein n=1 Tax=Erythrobacter sp. WG TaxID=2985510 RepID=UPI002B4BB4FC|nr:DUF3597 family protein [Erythrobacter sp. WG]